MRWRRRPRVTVEAIERARAEAKLRAAERQTPVIENLAKVLRNVSTEEMSVRMRRAMTLVDPDEDHRGRLA